MSTESHYHSKKDRVFVRAIAGAYNLKDELNRLRSLPRVRKAKDIKFNDGPQTFSRHYVEPKDGITQTFHIHIEEYGPGGKSQKHGHVNEAAFYILDGKGYKIHDGIRYDCGSKLGYLQATVEYALKHSEVSEDFAAYLKNRVC
jgi:glyoxylate utilization-related uncharacterized protein